MNEVEVANLALARIGNGTSNRLTGNSFDTNLDTELGRAADYVYDNDLKMMLIDYEWPFAISSQALVLSATPYEVAGHDYIYSYPTQSIFLRGVTNAYGNPLIDRKIQNVDYEIYRDITANEAVIATSQADAYAWYTTQVAVDNCPQYFVNALAWKLAASLALALKADPRMAQFAQDQYTQAVGSALAIAANEHGARSAYVPQTVAAIIS